MRAISRNEARALDRRASDALGIPSLCLMENAGAGSARLALERWKSLAPTAICVCGPGQNGGDGLVVARHLAAAGGSPRIVLLARSAESPDPPGDAGANLRICAAMRIPLLRVAREADLAAAGEWISCAGLVVDALFGIGLDRRLEGTPAALVSVVADCGRPVLSLDVPSGLDCDTGEPLGPCVRADVTATFLAPKLGFAQPGARAWTGEVVVVGIGAPGPA